MIELWTNDLDGTHVSRLGIHVGLTAIIAWLAVYLDVSHDLFASDRGFAYMARIGSEHSWSVAFLISANVGVIGLLAARAAVRLVSVLIVSTMHGVFAGCLLLSEVSVWSGTYAIIAAMGYYLAYQQTQAGLSLLQRTVIQPPRDPHHD